MDEEKYTDSYELGEKINEVTNKLIAEVVKGVISYTEDADVVIYPPGTTALITCLAAQRNALVARFNELQNGLSAETE